MFKLIFGLAFVSMALGKEYPGYDAIEGVGGEKYFVSKEKIMWGQAWAACQVNGWTVAMEQNAKDTKAIDEALAKAKRDGKDYYIGGYLYEHDKTAEWIWLETGAVMKYTNFERKEPFDTRHCVVKTTESKALGKWRPVGCLEAHHYICQDV